MERWWWGGSIARAPGRVISSRFEMFLERTPGLQQQKIPP